MIIKSPVGLPGRAIKNPFCQKVEQGKRTPFTCPYHCIRTCDFKNSPYCIALALASARNGHVDKGLLFAGANAYKVNEIVSVEELIRSLQEEYDASAPDPSVNVKGQLGASGETSNFERRAANE